MVVRLHAAKIRADAVKQNYYVHPLATVLLTMMNASIHTHVTLKTVRRKMIVISLLNVCYYANYIHIYLFTASEFMFVKSERKRLPLCAIAQRG